MERGRLVGMMEGGRMEQLMKRIPKVDKLPININKQLNKQTSKQMHLTNRETKDCKGG